MDTNAITKGTSQPYADGPTTQRILAAIQNRVLQSEFNSTDLLAPTPHAIIAEIKGKIVRAGFTTTVQIGTGGQITVEVNDVVVAGLAVVVPDGALVNTKFTDTPESNTPTVNVNVGDKIDIIPAAAFATAGAGIAWVEIEPT